MNFNLEKQLSELLNASVISPETAENITAYYESKQANKPNRLFTIFGVLGALLSGLGIILIIAHNWDDMSKSLKSFFAFLPLVIGQGLCAYSFIKKKGPTWIESSSTFLILAVGATISLVSQIYNIPGDLGNFLLVWVLVTAPMMYLMRSNLSIVFHLILTTWYACEIGYTYRGPNAWWYFALLAWVVPFYLNLQKTSKHTNITGVLNWLLPFSLVIVLASFTQGHSLAFLMYLALFGLFYNMGQLPWFQSQKLRRNGFTVIGSLGTTFVLIFMTFEWFWKDALFDSIDTTTVALTITLYVAAISFLVYGCIKKTTNGLNLFQYAFLIIGLLYLSSSLGYLHNMVLTNILVASLGLIAVRIGVAKSSYGILNYGLLIISVLIICRFFDTDIDFIVRGLLFILVGLGFFFANYLLLKKQRKTELNTTPKKD